MTTIDGIIWWAAIWLWSDDGTPAIVDTTWRPTEDDALRNIYTQARLLYRTRYKYNLSPFHQEVLKWERYYLEYQPPVPASEVPGRVAEKLKMYPRQVDALLDEASAIIALREVIGMNGQVDKHRAIEKVA